jgi:hypothetical protein
MILLNAKDLIKQKQSNSSVRIMEFLEYIQAKFDNSLDISITVFKDEIPNYSTYSNLYIYTLEELGYRVYNDKDAITIKAQ